MMEYGFLSVISPIVAIALAIWTRQVLFSLFVGLAIGWIIIEEGFFIGLYSSVDAMINVFASAGNTRTVVFTLIIGALIQMVRYS